MGSIRELPAEVIEKIAAGEVVERPASVVRELVENSIDAGARSISCDLAEGGRQRITVSDDGAGMDAEDVARCVFRHATSKLAAADDLWKIRTMGFRGEALSAIGAVSRMTIESRPNRPEIIEGAKIEVEGGVSRGPVACGCAGGTRVVVSELFFNVPARLKFLKSPAVESGHAYAAFVSLALANPETRFELVSDGKKRFVSPAGDLEGRVREILGKDAGRRMTKVEEEGGGLAISGWLSEGGRSQWRDVHIFLNRRPVRDRMLMHALSAAFEGRIAHGEYPASVLWLDIDPSQVDVNVHPAKREVRFASPGAVHDFVVAACRKALAAASNAQKDAVLPNAKADPSLRLAASGACNSPAILSRGSEAARSFEFRRRKETALGTGQPDLGVAHEKLRVIGQLGTTYVLCEEVGGTLVLIDQHAAHERIGFDCLRKSFAQGFVPQQVLLAPESVELEPKELAYLVERLDLIEKAGFEVEPFGGKTLLVKAVPEV
ncbi:MAG TPA: DNA mismatch repair endonuclease MutL, partial [bacterium]|nr:DNA mismatch repair endonuclease MutL [bacterium]